MTLIDTFDSSLGFEALKIYAIGGCSTATGGEKNVAELSLADVDCSDLRLEDGVKTFLLSERIAFFRKMHEMRKLQLGFEPVMRLRDLMVTSTVGNSTTNIPFEEAETEGFCLLWRDEYCSLKDVNDAIREKRIVDARETLKKHREDFVKNLNYRSSCTAQEKETMKGIILRKVVEEIHAKGFALLGNVFSFEVDPGHLLCIVDLINDIDTTSLPLKLFPCQCLANFWILKNPSCVISNKPTSTMYLSQLFAEILLHNFFFKKAQEAETADQAARDEGARDQAAQTRALQHQAALDAAAEYMALHPYTPTAPQSSEIAKEREREVKQMLVVADQEVQKSYEGQTAYASRLENKSKADLEAEESLLNEASQNERAMNDKQKQQNAYAAETELLTQVKNFTDRAMYNFRRNFEHLPFMRWPDIKEHDYDEVENKCRQLGITPWWSMYGTNKFENVKRFNNIKQVFDFCNSTFSTDRAMLKTDISYLLALKGSIPDANYSLIICRIALLLNHYDGLPINEDVISKDEFYKELKKELMTPETNKHIKETHFQTLPYQTGEQLALIDASKLWNEPGFRPNKETKNTIDYVEDKVRKNIYDRRRAQKSRT